LLTTAIRLMGMLLNLIDKHRFSCFASSLNKEA
jgi:hypothetical protein